MRILVKNGWRYVFGNYEKRKAEGLTVNEIMDHLFRKLKSRLDEEKDTLWFDPQYDYKDAFFDCKILKWITVGDYQGDHFVMVEKDGEYGYSVIAFGS